MQRFSFEGSTSYAADVAACRAQLSTGSRTFFAASFLLPRRVREPASALYAFCRLADDAVDLGADPERALEELRHRLDCAYAGQPWPVPADRAFAATVDRFDIPRALPEALLEGFAWDTSGRQYEDLASLQAYAARVAGTVGAMMACLMGARSPYDLARATDLGIAMQLTNVARDVGEDARAGRLYLPRQWLAGAGIDPVAWLSNPEFSPELAGVVERLLAVAEALYARAGSGIARLPGDCRPGIYAARYLYAGIGHELARQGYDSVARRAVVPAARKLQLLGRAVAAAPRKRSATGAAATREAAFLVSAAARGGPWAMVDGRSAERVMPWADFYAKTVNVIELFERLKRRDMGYNNGPLDGSDAQSPAASVGA